MTGFLYTVLALLLFGFIVIVHEFGHFVVGRLCGIAVEEFSVGFGPKLFGRQGRHTAFSVRLIPFGGYCRFIGEDESNDRPDAMKNQNVWKRIATVVAGPCMNFVLAYVAILVYLTLIGVFVSAPVVAGVTEGMPAQIAGMREGDIITAINGAPITEDHQGAQDIQTIIGAADPGEPITFEVRRDGEALSFTIAPESTDEGMMIGIYLGVANFRYPFFPALKDSGILIVGFAREMLETIRSLFTQRDVLSQVMGPVGIVSVMSESIQRGFDVVLNLLLTISLNLGIVNLLPLPALDGGRLIFLLVEAVRRKPIKPEYEGWVHAAGFMLLFGLIIVITYKDIARLITGG